MSDSPKWHGTWTPELEAHVSKLFIEGVSASQIAKRLWDGQCPPPSRNAVIGKLHRLGVSGPKAVGRVRSTPRVRAIAAGTEPVTALHPSWAKRSGASRPPRQAPSLALVSLSRHQCKWPIGDPREADFGYCESRAVESRPYCAAHLKEAHAAPNPSRTAKDLERKLARLF